ncbi:hypothetical protein PR202_ga30113 [Eleusine coracana subsp. coracana]|uniref:Uncharacterized protein n=2 Tax=Eleusine coracana subsp. coracana TaxID=191504 RepID=A0AAV5DLN8_ELECO|nr:hypothetical protein PR202_ga30113 [Eleusine coracana subsp. coracana]
MKRHKCPCLSSFLRCVRCLPPWPWLTPRLRPPRWFGRPARARHVVPGWLREAGSSSRPWPTPRRVDEGGGGAARREQWAAMRGADGGHGPTTMAELSRAWEQAVTAELARVQAGGGGRARVGRRRRRSSLARGAATAAAELAHEQARAERAHLDEIRPFLPQLLDEFFKLMSEVENEDLVFTLETIVDKFGEEMAPYALGLCQSLAAAFWRCMASSEADEEAEDTGALAAVGCLRAISTILESISSLPHLYIQIEPTLLPILRKMLTSDGQGIVLSAQLKCPCRHADILVPLDNYVSRGTDHFLSCKDPDYQHSLWKALSTILTDQNMEDSDVVPAPKLIEVFFQNCKGRVDHWVEPYLRLTIDRLRRTEKPYLKCLLLQVVRCQPSSPVGLISYLTPCTSLLLTVANLSSTDPSPREEALRVEEMQPDSSGSGFWEKLQLAIVISWGQWVTGLQSHLMVQNAIANALYYNPLLALEKLHALGVATEIFNLWFVMLQQVRKSGQRANFRR